MGNFGFRFIRSLANPLGFDKFYGFIGGETNQWSPLVYDGTTQVDNGASAEGTMHGLFNEMTYFNGIPETVQDQLKHIDEWGGPNTYAHFAAGQAVAMDAPYIKQVASDFGRTRNGIIIRWSNGIKAKGEIRSQFSYVIDIAPTIFEACKIPAPKIVNGIKQDPIEGTCMLYSFDDAKAKERHTTQYFEVFGNRAIYSMELQLLIMEYLLISMEN